MTYARNYAGKNFHKERELEIGVGVACQEDPFMISKKMEDHFILIPIVGWKGASPVWLHEQK